MDSRCTSPPPRVLLETCLTGLGWSDGFYAALTVPSPVIHCFRTAVGHFSIRHSRLSASCPPERQHFPDGAEFWFPNTRFCKVSWHSTRQKGLSNRWQFFLKKTFKFRFVTKSLPCDFLSYYQHTFLVSNYSDSCSYLFFPLLAISPSNHNLHPLSDYQNKTQLFGVLKEFDFVSIKLKHSTRTHRLG